MKKVIFMLTLSTLVFAKYVIINNPVYTNIYSVSNMIPVIGIVHLTQSIVKQRKKRINSFHQNPLIPKSAQASNKDYRNSLFDRGHFSASNADWDDNITNQRYTFSFTNMTPQYKKTNRRSYRRVEWYGRKLTKIYKSVFVLSIAVPSKMMLHSKVNIPSVYYKIFMYNSAKECFRIPNDNKSYSLKDMRISCDTISIPML